MQVNTNYDTLNFNGKVNFFTMVRNQFSRAGRHANQEIAEIRASHSKIRINQEKIGDKIELSYTEKTDTGHINARSLISNEGLLETEVNGARSFGANNQFNLIHTIKRIFRESDIDLPTETIETQTVVNNSTHRIEEFARKQTNLYGPVEIKVSSKANRESMFPMTTIAKNIHPAQATRHTNADGDIVYIERYAKE